MPEPPDPLRETVAVPADPAATNAHAPEMPPSGTASEIGAFADRLMALGAGGSADTCGGAADTAAAAAAPPGFAVVRELGRGGMGVVYLARDAALGRPVALKMILPEGRSSVVRFLAEAEAVASVRHPNVVQVYGYGQHAGRPFLALEYLPGGTLADRLRTPGAGDGPREPGVRLAPAEAAALVGKVASGVAAAHEQGIVHRDLKPGNVLLDAAGEPKVADFGLAKRGTRDLTATQAVMGTPSYMAPEQAGGRAKFVGPQADVWALGVILYECLTGTRPFVADSTQEVLSRVMFADPPRPRSVAPGVPRDLELVCLKCLAKEPAERYPTAAELADDLGRFVRGEPVAVRAAGLLERAYKWARRKPTVAGLYAATILGAVLVAVTAGFALLWRDAESARGRAVTAHEQAEDARRGEEEARRGAEKDRDELKTAREKLAVAEYGRTIQVAYQAWLDSNVGLAISLLDRTRQDLRGWEWRYVHKLCNGQVVSLRGHKELYSAVWSPDGTRIATGASDKTARIWDAATGEELHVLRGHTGPVWYLAWSPDGSKVATGIDAGLSWSEERKDNPRIDDKTVRVWDARTGMQLAVLGGHTGSEVGLAWSPDGTRLMTVVQYMTVGNYPKTDKPVRVWDTANWTEVAAPKGSGHVSGAEFSPDGSRLLIRGENNVLCDTRTWTTSPVRVEGYEWARWAPNGMLLFQNPSGFAVLDVATGKTVVTHAIPDIRAMEAFRTSFVAKGSRMILDYATARSTSTGPERAVRVWDVATWKEVSATTTHTHLGYDDSFSPDGSRALTAHEGMVKVWDVWTWQQLDALKAPFGGGTFLGLRDFAIVNGIWSPDGSRVLTGHTDGSLRIWEPKRPDLNPTPKDSNPALKANPSSGRTAYPFSEFAGIDGVAVGRSLRLVVPKQRLKGESEPAYVEDEITRKKLAVLDGFPPVSADSQILWNPDGSRIALKRPSGKPAGREPRRAEFLFWDATTGAKTGETKVGFSADRLLSWSPDGSRILVARWPPSPEGNQGEAARSIWVLDGATGKEVALRDCKTSPPAVSWSPDGTKVAIAFQDGQVRLWDARTGSVLGTLLHGTEMAYDTHGPRWSPDGQRVVTFTREGIVQVWNAATATTVVTLRGHAGAISAASFSPDGARLVTAGGGTVRIWDTKAWAELVVLEDHSGGVRATGWSRDGTRLVTSSPSETRIWAAETGIDLLALKGGSSDWGDYVGWSPDGTKLVAGASVWDATPTDCRFLPKEVAPAPRGGRR